MPFSGTPKAPTLTEDPQTRDPTYSFLQSGPDRLVVIVQGLYDNDAEIDDISEVQMERYLVDENTALVWRDWTTIENFDQPQIDINIRPDILVGYRVRFKDSSDNVSNWSAWATTV